MAIFVRELLRRISGCSRFTARRAHLTQHCQ
jgi:hypothetical protein